MVLAIGHRLATRLSRQYARSSSQLTTAQFSYRDSLHGHEIRVLRLEPASSSDSEIKCSLGKKPLSTQWPLNYEALSYNWGNTANDEKIWVNAQLCSVTTNLKSFLQHRRQSQNFVDLWIDALCINQADLQEKSQQIPLMNVIYMASSQLTIWLGPGSEDSHIAMEYLKELGQESTYTKMPILKGTMLTAIQRLLSRSWFSRIWIVQELVLGGMAGKMSRVSLRCGDNEMPWATFIVALARMRAHQDDMRQFFPNISKVLTLDSVREQALSMILRPAKKHHILNLLSRYRTFQSTDQKDKIYALLGLVFGPDATPFTNIHVDYSASTCKVYTDFARYMLQSCSKLDLLRHCHHRSVPELPSWAPDWTADIVVTPLPSRNDKELSASLPWWARSDVRKELDFVEGISDSDFRKHKKALEERARKGEEYTKQRLMSRMAQEGKFVGGDYKAAGTTTPKIRLDAVDQELIAEGILHDVVHAVHDAFPEDLEQEWEASTHFMVAVGQCKQMALNYSQRLNPYGSLVAQEQAFWITLFAGRRVFTDDGGRDVDLMECLRLFKWLPLIPGDWQQGIPPVTVTTLGRLESQDGINVVFDIQREFLRDTGKDPTKLEMGLDGLDMYPDLQPKEWTLDVFYEHVAKFKYLALLWQNQPYDLWRRPFMLPSVVPDPYHRDRVRDGPKILTQTLRSDPVTYRTIFDPELSPSDIELNQRWEEVAARSISSAPQCTIVAGLERYALGRSFFVTKKGFFGIGPRDVKKGDNVSVMLGSDVPFILRRHESNVGFRLIGETYVHGIMEGEVIRDWDEGQVEVGKIVLR